MSRKAAREVGMKLLYERAMGGQGFEFTLLDLVTEGTAQLKSDEMEYINNIVNGVYAHLEEIDAIISKYAIGWKINRIARIDLSIIRLSIFEMKYRVDIPDNVSINEALELAKKYSNPEAGPFINGILASFQRNHHIQKDTDET